jgi:META domain
MLVPRWCYALCLALALLAGLLPFAAKGDTAFPFGTALVLEAAPQPGSKRVPMIEIEDSGAATFYLWCASARGTANVGDATITLTPTAALPSQCTPEEISRDADLLAQLAQMTGWRREGDELELVGVSTLRFHLMTN